MTTEVAITFDIEFDINGAFAQPSSRKPIGREGFIASDNRGGVSGLDRILEILGAHNIRATFFIEALQTAWFGVSEMGEIVHKIQKNGHELQLHLHPVWLIFDQTDWVTSISRQEPVTQTHDSLVAVSHERALEIVERGKEVFQQWNLPAPSAIRTGSLIMEKKLYPVFAECGLPISSSIGLGLYQPEDPELHLFSCARQFDEVTELPVSSYFGADYLFRKKRRLATVIGMGKREQSAFLKQAQRIKCPFLVILSHVSEFLTVSASGMRAPNRLTESKFEKLCRTVQGEASLRTVTVAELGNKITATTAEDILVNVPRHLSAMRFTERVIQ